MKTLFTHIALVWALAACGTAAPPAATATALPTPLPSSTPEPTPTSTATPDPNAPADASGRDAAGYYKDVQENGKLVRYEWVDLKYGVKGWFASHILDGNLLNGGIPLLDLPWIRTMPFTFYAQEGVQAPYLRHLQQSTDPYSPSFSGAFVSHLYLRYFNETNWRRITAEETQQFNADLPKGDITFAFHTSTGDYVWRLSESTGYRYYAVDWVDADPAIHPEFYESSAGKYRWRWTAFSDAPGNLIVFVAQQQKQTKLSDALLSTNQDDVLYWILLPMFQTMSLPQFPAKIKYLDYQGALAHMTTEGLTSRCLQVNPLNPDGTTRAAIEACSVAHFEILQAP